MAKEVPSGTSFHLHKNVGAVSGESIYYGYLLFIVALNALCIFILNLRFKKTDIF